MKINKIVSGLALLYCSSSSVYADSWEYCGDTPVFPESMEAAPVDIPFYVRGSHSNWQPNETFRFRYVGENKYQVRADFPQNFQFKIANDDATWSEQLWVPDISGQGVEQQSLSLNYEYPLNWQNGGFGNNLMFLTGEMLLTFTLEEGAQQGDANAGLLEIDHCGSVKPHQTLVQEVRRPSLSSTLVSGVGANDAVTIGPNGNVYIANIGTWGGNSWTGSEVIRVTPEGEREVFASGFSGPRGLSWGSDGYLYVIAGNGTQNSASIMRVDANGSWTPFVDIVGGPSNLVEGDNQYMFVTNFWRQEIHRVDMVSGEQEVFASHFELGGSTGIVFDPDSGDLFVSNFITGKVLRVDNQGNVSEFAQVPAQVGYLTKLGANLYATGINANRVYQIKPSGKVKRLGGSGVMNSVDNITIHAEFAMPNGIAADPASKKIYISEFGAGNNLRVVDFKFSK